MKLVRPVDLVGVAVATCLLATDQFSKWLVARNVHIHESIQVIPGLLNITHVRNTGAAFGILSSPEPGLRSSLLLGFSLLALGFILWVWFRERPTSRLQVISLAMILGGALGNLVDRARLGQVLDFLDFYWRQYHWPAFNVADSAVTVGVILFLVGVMNAPGREGSPMAS